MNVAMAVPDQAIPILPSRSIAGTVAFYRQLGFEGDAHAYDSGYAILCRGAIELHFFAHPALNPAENDAGCYLRVQDVQAIYRAFAAADLPAAGVPRMDALEAKPWGMKEFAVIDLDGNLIRVGQEMAP